MSTRNTTVDALRGFAVLWMTVFHFCFDLNYFGFIQQDFYRSPIWTVQRTCILSLFLLCAGWGQALALQAGQSWPRFWRRWSQIAGCALLVSVGSAAMFPKSWIYFGVLHGMAVMLIVCRLSARWGRWLWLWGALAIALGVAAPWLHRVLDWPAGLNDRAWNWLGLIRQKPITEDYVPLLPWMGVMWWGVALGQWASQRGWLSTASDAQPGMQTKLAWIGRWSLSWYMVHQPVLIAVLSAAVALRA